MRSKSKWKRWAEYAAATGHTIIDSVNGCDLVWCYPCGITACIEFGSRRGLLGHLRKDAVDDLREDYILRHDVRYAVRTDDLSYIRSAIDVDGSEASDAARASHTMHRKMAKRLIPRRGRLDLIYAVQLSNAFATTSIQDLYAHQLEEERARHSKTVLEAQLAQYSTAGAGRPRL